MAGTASGRLPLVIQSAPSLPRYVVHQPTAGSWAGAVPRHAFVASRVCARWIGLAVAGTVQQAVSGAHDAREHDEPIAMRAYLLAAGVPDAAIIDDPAGYDTTTRAAGLTTSSGWTP